MAVLVHLELKTFVLFSLHFAWFWVISVTILKTVKLVGPQYSTEHPLGLRAQSGNSRIGKKETGKAQGLEI